MAFNIPTVPGTLATAHAASYAKGLEVSKENSSEEQDRQRLNRQRLQVEKVVEVNQKLQGTKKGYLA